MIFLRPQANYALEPKSCNCFMQPSQHQRQNFRSKTALLHLTRFLHNTAFEIRNSKFSPNDQLHSCAAYSNSSFLPSSLLSCLASLKTNVYQRQQRAQPGKLNSSSFRFVNAYRKMDGQNDFIEPFTGKKGTQITWKYKTDSTTIISRI